jgi:hypothetical protein
MPVLRRVYPGQYHLFVQEGLTQADFSVKSHETH